eukprot:528644_1
MTQETSVSSLWNCKNCNLLNYESTTKCIACFSINENIGWKCASCNVFNKLNGAKCTACLHNKIASIKLGTDSMTSNTCNDKSAANQMVPNKPKNRNELLLMVIAWFIRKITHDSSFVYHNIELIIKEYLKYSQEIMHPRFLRFSPRFIISSDNDINFKSTIKGTSLFGWCVSTVGFIDGIHTWTIKCIETTFDGIGIITNVKGFMGCRTWPFDERKSGITYQLLNNVTGQDIQYQGIYEYTHGINTKHEKIEVQWKKNDVIDVMIDCIAWELSYFVNSHKIGKINIAPKHMYYPAFVFSDTTAVRKRSSSVYTFNYMSGTDLFIQ